MQSVGRLGRCRRVRSLTVPVPTVTPSRGRRKPAWLDRIATCRAPSTDTLAEAHRPPRAWRAVRHSDCARRTLSSFRRWSSDPPLAWHRSTLPRVAFPTKRDTGSAAAHRVWRARVTAHGHTRSICLPSISYTRARLIDLAGSHDRGAVALYGPDVGRLCGDGAE